MRGHRLLLAVVLMPGCATGAVVRAVRAGDSAPGASASRTRTPDDGTPGPGADQAASGSPSPSRAEGSVAGALLHAGQGAVGWGIRVVPMARNLGMLAWEEVPGPEFRAETGAGGQFVIRDVPPGAYRLKWHAPHASHWVKRLRESPDILVDGAAAVSLGNVEVGGRVR